MFSRTLKNKIISYAQLFPGVFLTGPRQSGKTTILKMAFPDYQYISLENPNTLAAVQFDPIGYFKDTQQKWIIDEAQEFPDLFKYLQGFIDQTPTPGRFILSGSQNFLLNEKISQSLAGRVGVLELLPLTYEEYITDKPRATNVWSYLFYGQYPRPLLQEFPSQDWISSYLRTYVERDVRNLLAVQNLSKFQTFLRLCAARHGQLLNLSALAVDAGIAQTTATSWISMMEASYLCFRLRPYHNNFKKRLVKMPKLYFYDSGLVCFLLGIESIQQLQTSSSRGAIFEGFILSEMIKKRFNHGKPSNLYFWRDHLGLEIDIVREINQKLESIEVKSSETFQRSFLDNLHKFIKMSSQETESVLVYCGKESFIQGDISIQSWEGFCLNQSS